MYLCSYVHISCKFGNSNVLKFLLVSSFFKEARNSKTTIRYSLFHIINIVLAIKNIPLFIFINILF